MRTGRRRPRLSAALLALSLTALSAPASAADLDASPPDPAPQPATAAPSSEVQRPPVPWPGWLPSPQVFVPLRPSSPPDLYILPGYSAPLSRFESMVTSPEGQMRLRSSLGILAVMGINSVYYWQDPPNRLDWELHWIGPDWNRKLILGNGISFDGNVFETNTVMHPLAGTLFFLSARGSGLSAGEALAFSFTSSTVWEYVAEFREKVSLNDLLVTPATGSVIGENLHQLSLFFERGDEGPANDVLSFVLSPARGLSRFLEHRRRERSDRLDRLGLPADVWHRFDLLIGAGATENGDGMRPTETRFGLHTELNQIPEYDRSGDVERAVADTSFSSLSAEAGFDQQGLVEIDLFAKVALGGYYRQDVVERARGDLKGYSLFAGTAAAFGYSRHDWPEGYVDRLGITYLPGAAIDLSLYRGHLRLRAGLDVFPDFASVQSPALDDYLDGRPPLVTKTELSGRGYYFAYGVTVRPAVSIGYRGIGAGADMNGDWFGSIEGLDRYQGSITDDFHLDDRRLNHRVWLTYAAPGDPAALSWATLESVQRRGSIGIFTSVREELRLRAGVGLLF